MLQRRELVGQLRSTFGKTETTITRSPRLRDRRFARFIRQQLTLPPASPPPPEARATPRRNPQANGAQKGWALLSAMPTGGASRLRPRRKGPDSGLLEKTSQPAAATKRSGSQVAG